LLKTVLIVILYSVSVVLSILFQPVVILAVSVKCSCFECLHYRGNHFVSVHLEKLCPTYRLHCNWICIIV